MLHRQGHHPQPVAVIRLVMKQPVTDAASAHPGWLVAAWLKSV